MTMSCQSQFGPKKKLLRFKNVVSETGPSAKAPVLSEAVVVLTAEVPGIDRLRF